MTEIIPFAEGEARLDWLGLVNALEAGHRLPKAEINDSFLYRGSDTLLNRAAWIDGLGLAVKSATVFPGNRDHGAPAINGAVSLFSDRDGTLDAIIDFHLVTKWKTAGDSLRGALLLARPDSKTLLIVGAGTVAQSLVQAYRAGFPGIEVLVWNRTFARAQALATQVEAEAVPDLQEGLARADIISSATMSTQPVLKGDWLRPGQHLDLIGAYRPDMRETDDSALLRARVFVDSFDTTLGHIGELKIPIESGVIDRDHVLADFYSPQDFCRSADDITLFKNGGGAHMDLMTSRYILDCWRG